MMITNNKKNNLEADWADPVPITFKVDQLDFLGPFGVSYFPIGGELRYAKF